MHCSNKWKHCDSCGIELLLNTNFRTSVHTDTAPSFDGRENYRETKQIICETCRDKIYGKIPEENHYRQARQLCLLISSFKLLCEKLEKNKILDNII